MIDTVRRPFSALFFLSMIVAGCGPAAVADDMGVDAGIDAAEPIDSGPIDMGPPPVVCTGTPPTCASRMTAPECAMVLGCAYSQCAGFALACDMNGSEMSCEAEMGCMWTGTECLGTATPCGTFPESAACSAQAGCTWSTATQCRGTSTPCATLGAACMSQPGCMVE